LLPPRLRSQRKPALAMPDGKAIPPEEKSIPPEEKSIPPDGRAESPAQAATPACGVGPGRLCRLHCPRSSPPGSRFTPSSSSSLIARAASRLSMCLDIVIVGEAKHHTGEPDA